ncbi:hypothetical protein KJ656_14625 [bacterium]|nr:hypothetical protein [bacterium]
MPKSKIDEICTLIDQLVGKLTDFRNEVWEDLIDIKPEDTPAIKRHAEKMETLNHLIEKSKDNLDSIRYILSNFESGVQGIKTVKEKDNSKQYLGESTYSLNKNLTHRKPSEIRFRGEVYFANNWNHLFEWLIKRILALNLVPVENILEDKYLWGRKRHYFSDSPSGLRKPKSVGQNIWMETNLSANAFRDIAQHLLEKVGIPPDEVRIKLRR